MQLTESMPYASALAEIERLMDLKKIFPKQRERLKLAIEAVAEGMQYGYVSIAEDGQIVQKLSEPLPGTSEITYKARVEPYTINTELQKAGTSVNNIVLVYQKLYTGLPTATFQKLEPFDKNIADAITYFFQ